VIFDGLAPHGTPTNTSADARRALQFHWTRKSAVRAAKVDQLAAHNESFETLMIDKRQIIVYRDTPPRPPRQVKIPPNGEGGRVTVYGGAAAGLTC
jgi:hypothetical protein